MRKGRSLQAQIAAKQISPLGLAGFLAFLILGGVLAVVLSNARLPEAVSGGALIISLLPGIYILFALRMASEWEKAVVLRAGKFMGLRGPGLFWLLPVVDSIPVWIDHRVMVTPFNAEKTLTKDTVPVDVDAVLSWVVWDAQKAALEVEDYRAAITWAAQTALRDVIGKMLLADTLRVVGRDSIDKELQRVTLAQHASAGRRAHHALGGERQQRRDPRHTCTARRRKCHHPARAGRRHVAPAAGRARAAGARDAQRGRVGKTDRAELRRCLTILHRQPHGAAPAGHEHALRGAQAEGRAGHRPVLRRGHDEPGRHDRHGGAGQDHRSRRP